MHADTHLRKLTCTLQFPVSLSVVRTRWNWDNSILDLFWSHRPTFTIEYTTLINYKLNCLPYNLYDERSQKTTILNQLKKSQFKPNTFFVWVDQTWFSFNVDCMVAWKRGHRKMLRTYSDFITRVTWLNPRVKLIGELEKALMKPFCR